MNHTLRLWAIAMVALLLLVAGLSTPLLISRSAGPAGDLSPSGSSHPAVSGVQAAERNAPVRNASYVDAAAPIATPPAPDGDARGLAAGYLYSAAPIFRPPAPAGHASAWFPAAAGVSRTSPGAVINWNAVARHAAIDVAKQYAPQAMVYVALAQAAVYNAVVAIQGGYQPYKVSLDRQPGASVDAAVATAARDILVHYFPGQQAALDAEYADSLAAIPQSKPKEAGIQVGREAAAGIIALRQGDGLEANIHFTMPAPGPGIWQLPAGQSPQTPWLSQLRPFMIESPDQFRPGPPPALDSPAWAAEFDEVKQLGAANSSARTPEQTDIARFWSDNSVRQYNTVFGEVAEKERLDAVQAARLFAMGNMAGADALIACFDAKYHYLFWRPQFAIPGADTDGNPATDPQAGWQPLLSTPNHPEYPGGHGCLTTAEAAVLATFLGTNEIDVEITSKVTGVVQSTRHYRRAEDLVREITDARVWGGLHYRGSAVTGAQLGGKVAAWTLSRYFLPDSSTHGYAP